MIIIKNRTLLSIVIVLLLLVVTGCSQNQGNKIDKIKLGYVNWAEGIAMTHLAKAIIEENMDYEVETMMADVGPIFQGMASGDIDAFMDVWLPITHHDYVDKLENKIQKIGTNYKGAKIGLVVPEYVNIKSIEEMNQNKDKFNNEIIGIDAGAGIMQTTNKAIDEYGLNFDLIEGSGPAMTASLKKAIDNKEWIVVTGWKPHWKFARWKLKFLEDPRGIYGQKENLYTYARKGLKEDAPDLVSFLDNFSMTTQQLGNLMGMIADGKKPLEAAKEWMKENPELVNKWLGK